MSAQNIYKGYGGNVELRPGGLVIRRNTFLGFFMHGLKGEKFIPFSSITSVQFKSPGLLNGYIQFGIKGAVENTRGYFGSFKDENTVYFWQAHAARFEELRGIVESRIAS